MGSDRSLGGAADRVFFWGKIPTARSHGGSLRSRRLTLEPLEKRTLLATGMVDLGPSDNVALDQPRVTIELLTPTTADPGPDDWGRVGPHQHVQHLLRGPDQSVAKIYGNGYYNRAKFFEVVEVYLEGGGDIVKLFDSEGDDVLEAGPDSGRLYGDGFDVSVFGYEQLKVFASEGNDTAHFFDSPGDDLVRARPHKVMVWYDTKESKPYDILARRFNEYYFTSENGGFDRAKLHDSVFNDYLAADTDSAALYAGDDLDLLYEAVGFDWVKAYGTPDSNKLTNRNTRDVAGALDYELLYWGQWE